MSEKISEKFHDYVFNQSEVSGVEDQISEINDVASGKNIELSVALESGAGEKYFYESMKLAENVIKSFETEQPKLNENQEIVLEWLKNQYLTHYRKAPLVLLAKFGWSVVGYEMPIEIQHAYRLLKSLESLEVLQAFATWALDQC